MQLLIFIIVINVQCFYQWLMQEVINNKSYKVSIFERCDFIKACKIKVIFLSNLYIWKIGLNECKENRVLNTFMHSKFI